MPRPRRERRYEDARGVTLAAQLEAFAAGAPGRLLESRDRSSVVLLLEACRVTLRRTGRQLADNYRQASPPLGDDSMAFDEPARTLAELRALYLATERLMSEVRHVAQRRAEPSLFD